MTDNHWNTAMDLKPMESESHTAGGVEYFVMEREDDAWIRISRPYSERGEAVQALEALLREHPFARLGGVRPD